jgi:hypothetical protein
LLNGEVGLQDSREGNLSLGDSGEHLLVGRLDTEPDLTNRLDIALERYADLDRASESVS